MEWLSTFIFRTVEFLDRLTDNIGKHMGKFLFICLVIFLAMLLWPKPPTPLEQRGVVEKGAVQEKNMSDRLKEWMIENTPKQ